MGEGDCLGTVVCLSEVDKQPRITPPSESHAPVRCAQDTRDQYQSRTPELHCTHAPSAPHTILYA
jgi:hypothetical protein